MTVKHLQQLAIAIALLGLAACGEEASTPKAPDAATPASQPATQPSLKNTAGLVQTAAADAVAINANCPLSGDPVNPKSAKLTYAKKTIGFCCDDCVKAFKADPDKYAAKLN